MAGRDEYRRSGVDYDVLDDVKREAIALAAATAPLLAASSGAEVSESRGSSAYVFEVNGTTLALVVEGLGTKSIIASDYLEATGVSRFADIAQDAVAAIVNDVISVGANPLVVTAYFATGDAAWYGQRDRSLDLLNGWRKACEEAGAVWGGGESPALPGIVTSRCDRAGRERARPGSAWPGSGARHATSLPGTRSSCCRAVACTRMALRWPGASPRGYPWGC